MKVVILGANGTMGAPSGAVFAGAGFEVVMLARDLDKARTALGGAQSAARADAVADRLSCRAWSGVASTRPKPNSGVGIRKITLFCATAVAKSGCDRVHPAASVRPWMV